MKFLDEFYSITLRKSVGDWDFKILCNYDDSNDYWETRFQVFVADDNAELFGKSFNSANELMKYIEKESDNIFNRIKKHILSNTNKVL